MKNKRIYSRFSFTKIKVEPNPWDLNFDWNRFSFLSKRENEEIKMNKLKKKKNALVQLVEGSKSWVLHSLNKSPSKVVYYMHACVYLPGN